MPESALPPGAIGLTRTVWRLVLWVADHPFLLNRATWAIGAVFLIAVGLVLALTGAPLVLVVAAGGLFAVGVAGVVGWQRLSKSEGRLLVLRCPFKAQSEEGRAAASEHLVALKERLEGEPVLAERCHFRIVGASPTPQQAESLLQETRAHAVVFGGVRATSDLARWSARVLARWKLDDEINTYLDLSGELTQHPEAPKRKRQTDELPVDADHPLRALVTREFRARHADAITGVLFVVAAETVLDEGDVAEAAACVTAADRFSGSLSDRVRASLEIVRLRTEMKFGELAPPGAFRAYLERLRKIGKTAPTTQTSGNTATRSPSSERFTERTTPTYASGLRSGQ